MHESKFHIFPVHCTSSDKVDLLALRAESLHMLAVLFLPYVDDII